jgi:lipoyl(octanoyl) transferase
MNNNTFFEPDYLGRIDYGAAWELQKELVADRGANPDLVHKLLLLEHPHTYTLGRHADEGNLLLNQEQLAERGIAVYHVDRGGDITYHGPGQLVGYPIFYLGRLYGRGVGRIRAYVSDLEDVLINTLATFGIAAGRFEGFRGVWVDGAEGPNKIAAIGVYVNSNGISSHGFALNVHTDLSYFEGIVPCGIDDHGVTSISAELGRDVTFEEVMPAIIIEFGRVFGLEPIFEGITHEHD